ncbi:MAG TPA: MltA domain-containing protein [Candidatus Binatia bacterium]|jgi:membrane-bound lytic murein transglycosylase A
MFGLRKLLNYGVLTLAALAVSGCSVAPTTKLEPAAIVDDLDPESLRTAVRHSLAYLQRLPPDRIVGEQPRGFTAQEVRDSLLAFDKLLELGHCAACLAHEINSRFDLLPSSSDPHSAEVLFTGYYQPVIQGTLVPSEKFRYPIYAKPGDLITAELVTLASKTTVEKTFGRAEGEQFMPYYSRREIDEAGALHGRGLEIAWLADPVDRFFLHIQGSGLIQLPDGTQLNVGYHGQNGRPYRSIGRLLIDHGKIAADEMSMQRLRDYLRQHPEERNEILSHNESYVFFRTLNSGPLGSLEVPVTAGRSLATDARLFPKGALALIQTEIPVVDGDGKLSGWRPITRFVLNQDTGGAIRGLERADLYFGTGDRAAGLAGYMNRPGKIFFLMLKEDKARAEAAAADFKRCRAC